MKTIKNIAFTLAEIILAMGIIGIVATLTITNATKDTDVAEKVAQLRRSEEILSAAFAQAVAENGTIDTWNSSMDEMWPIISSYLKLQKNCNTGQGCWKNANITYIYNQDISGTTNYDTDSGNIRKGILSNGASFYMGTYFIMVDVNGKNKGLNKVGDDIFSFKIQNDGTILPHSEENSDITKNYDYCLGNGGYIHGEYCTAWVLIHGNQDYLKDCAYKMTKNGPYTCRD